jgi:hypothetical protein
LTPFRRWSTSQSIVLPGNHRSFNYQFSIFTDPAEPQEC